MGKPTATKHPRKSRRHLQPTGEHHHLDPVLPGAGGEHFVYCSHRTHPPRTDPPLEADHQPCSVRHPSHTQCFHAYFDQGPGGASHPANHGQDGRETDLSVHVSVRELDQHHGPSDLPAQPLCHGS